MGDLPPARLGYHQRPFTFCGIDYFGPMMVTVGRRREKRWGVLVMCLTTRAIHIELASSLNSSSAIMSLRRMMGRRGKPVKIHADNGTNLVGMNTELRDALLEIDYDHVAYEMLNRGIKWRFIPPSTPHMGGSWERLVRSIKTALAATLKERAPREEVLMTLLVEAEHVINSRPLTQVSVDHRDAEALTPNHFLIGSSSGVSSPGQFTDGDLCSRKGWRQSQRLADMFWSRWVKEYLPTLVVRKCWTQETRPLLEGDVVLVADSTLPRNTWPRGIITKTYPGKDARIRVADVRIRNKTFKRSAAKLVVLVPNDQ
ncbi:uncharacterized protein LOC122506336 [Leptopilina heterotoma]|uniref:uncharacterized protein LOC122506336 n=1 Tax=Leptopilina heterotoma TaxID=63436 RepID=UPI001CA7C117|nr:uncharacterized protein LOC122506336 [Leptopilina heterotoma]